MTARPSSPSLALPPSKKLKEEEEKIMAGPVTTSHLLIKRLSERATLPTRGSAYAAGLDLYS